MKKQPVLSDSKPSTGNTPYPPENPDVRNSWQRSPIGSWYVGTRIIKVLRVTLGAIALITDCEKARETMNSFEANLPKRNANHD
jgi:hypothetical protein